MPNPSQHLSAAPRLYLQGRSLSAREYPTSDDCPSNGHPGINSPTNMGEPGGTMPHHPLSSSTDQLLADCLRANVSLALPRPRHRILPCSPQEGVGHQEREQGEDGARYRKKSGAGGGTGQKSPKMNKSPTAQRIVRTEGTERRRKAFREQSAGGGGTGPAGRVRVQCRSLGQLHSTSCCSGPGSPSPGSLLAPPFQFGPGPSCSAVRSDSTGSEGKDKTEIKRKGKEAKKGRRGRRVSASSASGTPDAAIGASPALRKSTTDLAALTAGRASNINISHSAQQIILCCMEKARGDLAGRVLSRMVHKRADFSLFCANLASANQWTTFAEQFRDYLADVVDSVRNGEKIRLLSMQFGAGQVSRRVHGFKADFFSTMANSLATECVFLDGAMHQPTDAIEAWAELVESMFSSVRDGYYSEVRHQRRCIGVRACLSQQASNARGINKE